MEKRVGTTALPGLLKEANCAKKNTCTKVTVNLTGPGCLHTDRSGWISGSSDLLSEAERREDVAILDVKGEAPGRRSGRAIPASQSSTCTWVSCLVIAPQLEHK